MKVGLELQPCFGKRSGIGNYELELIRRLKNDSEIEFNGMLFNFLNRNHNEAVIDDIQIPISLNALFPYGVYRRIWNYLPVTYDRLFRIKNDLNIFFNYIVPPRINGDVVTVIYDMTYLRFPETMNVKNLKRIREGIQYSIKRSTHIITISEFSKNEIVDLLGIPGERISVVYSAPSVSCNAADYTFLKDKYHLRKPYILYVGTIEPRKNLVNLIHAYEALKREKNIPHQLMLAGGKGWNSKDIYDAANQSEFSSEIVFTDYISEEVKNCLYQKADVFVFPSIYEGFGMPPLEAMHWHCPVVVSDCSSLPEVVGDAAELVDPSNIQSIAAGVWHVISDVDRRNELVEKGNRRVLNFTWERSAQDFLSVIKKVKN